ncbi:Uncharacterised protein [Neisseria meningitidis]|nr:Uncharacterised protein [Neisseria meningitidis]
MLYWFLLIHYNVWIFAILYHTLQQQSLFLIYYQRAALLFFLKITIV